MSTKVLVVGRPFDLSNAPYDGFVTHHRRLVEQLAKGYDVSIMLLRPWYDQASLREELRPLLIGEIPIPAGPSSKSRRLVFAIKALRLAGWEKVLLEAARSIEPDVVLTLGPWLTREYRALYRHLPAVNLLEEDLTVMPDLYPQSAQARLLRRLEDVLAFGRATALAFVIGDAELVRASRKHPRWSFRVLRYTLDPDEFPLGTSPSDGTRLLVVGNFAEARNSDGLGSVLEHLAPHLPVEMKVRVVSGPGLHPSLEKWANKPWFDWAVDPTQMSEEYRNARLTLVPATRVTGVKTTVLQAWVSGCPVVATEAVAMSLPLGAQDALLVGRDAYEITNLILQAWTDSARRSDLSARGSAFVQEHFDASREQQKLMDALAEAIEARKFPSAPSTRKNAASRRS